MDMRNQNDFSDRNTFIRTQYESRRRDVLPAE